MVILKREGTKGQIKRPWCSEMANSTVMGVSGVYFEKAHEHLCTL